MSLTVPSLRPEPPIHPFGPVLRSRCFGRFSGRSGGGALGPRRPVLQAGPCPLRVEADEAPAPSASASAVPSQPCWWPLDLLAFSGSGREPFHFSSVPVFLLSCRAGGREETSRSDTLHLVTAPRGLRAARGWAPRRTTALRTAGHGPGATETRPWTSSVGARTPRPPGPSAAPGSVSQPPSWGPLFLLPVAMFDPCHFPAPRILCCLVSPEHSRPRRPVLGHPCRSPSVPSRDPSPPPWLYLLRGRIGPESP